MDREFELSNEYIELYKLLKIIGVAATGGHGKIMIDEGEVQLNGEVEYRRRAKIRKGDIVECSNVKISIV